LTVPTIRNRTVQTAAKLVLEPIFGAACKGIDQAGESPAAAVVRFGCVARHGVDGRRLWSAKAHANVLRATGSDSTGGLAKSRAAGDEHGLGVERLTRVNRVAGYWVKPSPPKMGEGQWAPMKERTRAVGACPGVLVVAREEWLVTQSREGLALAGPHAQVLWTRRGVSSRLADRVIVARMPRDNITLAEPRTRGAAACGAEVRIDPPGLGPTGDHDRVAEPALTGRQTRRRGRASGKRDRFRCLGAVLGKTRRTES